MGTIIEMGKVSSRGQIAIPADIRNQLRLAEGSKVLFFTEDDTLMMKKVTSETFANLTKPLRQAKKRIKESQVTNLIHRMRKR